MNCLIKHLRYAVHRKKLCIVQIARNGTIDLMQGTRFNSSGGPEKEEFSAKALIWKLVGLGTFFGAIGYGVYSRYVLEPNEAHVLREREKVLGANVEGHFDLIDQKRRRRRSEDYYGQWVLLFFGFTRCQTVCPTQLEKIASVVAKLDRITGFPRVTPIFITVDPLRDTPEVMGKYVREFSPKLVGLSGSYKEIENACKSYRVHISVPSVNPEDDYHVDHSIVTYLINPKGQITEVYDQSKSEDGIKNSILFHVRDFENTERAKPRYWK